MNMVVTIVVLNITIVLMILTITIVRAMVILLSCISILVLVMILAGGVCGPFGAADTCDGGSGDAVGGFP